MGSFSPNDFGLFDTSGNVAEWTADCANVDYVGAPGNGDSWQDGFCNLSVVRGGSWWHWPISLRASARENLSFTSRDGKVGFRVAHTLYPVSGPTPTPTPTPTPAPSCAICPDMLEIPAGSFQMGSNTGSDDEKPVHTVSFAGPFLIGVSEVTFAQWDRCVSDGGCAHSPDDEGWGRGVRPVINVSWEDISYQYIPWLNSETGNNYRLPSESEWEYAARAMTSTDYFWGNAIGVNNANCDGCGSFWDNSRTAPAGSFSPNGFGLYDTSGNVTEWTADCANIDYNGAPANGDPWVGGFCDLSVVRGGSWWHWPSSLRASNRENLNITSRDKKVGFRVAQSIDQPPASGSGSVVTVMP